MPGRPPDLRCFLKDVEEFARESYQAALDAFPKVDPRVLQKLSTFLCIPTEVLRYWRLDPSASFLTSLLQGQGKAVGAYDGRFTANDTGIAARVDPNSGGNDPTMTAIDGEYTAMWNVYVTSELKFTTPSPFMDMNDQAFANWSFDHVDPTGAQKGGSAALYTAGDLAAAMSLNPCLKVFCANGFYDAVTPYFQTVLNLEKMPLESAIARSNLEVHNYESGHMVYLDDKSRSKMKDDLVAFYRRATSPPRGVAAAFELVREETNTISYSPYQRRVSRTPY